MYSSEQVSKYTHWCSNLCFCKLLLESIATFLLEFISFISFIHFTFKWSAVDVVAAHFAIYVLVVFFFLQIQTWHFISFILVTLTLQWQIKLKKKKMRHKLNKVVENILLISWKKFFGGPSVLLFYFSHTLIW